MTVTLEFKRLVPRYKNNRFIQKVQNFDVIQETLWNRYIIDALEIMKNLINKDNEKGVHSIVCTIRREQHEKCEEDPVNFYVQRIIVKGTSTFRTGTKYTTEELKLIQNDENLLEEKFHAFKGNFKDAFFNNVKKNKWIPGLKKAEESVEKHKDSQFDDLLSQYAYIWVTISKNGDT